MRLTFIQPAIGHRKNKSYLASWQMEPLPIATLAGLIPSHFSVDFFDDRIEDISYDKPTDAVFIPIETYTAKRAAQIAEKYRARGIPVIAGGFHATLAPQDVAQFADCVVTGEAETILPEVLDDLLHRRLKARYHGARAPLFRTLPNRLIYRNKRYLPIALIETGRGCPYPCDFCAVQTFFERSYRPRDTAEIILEISALKKNHRLFFFVDDNFLGKNRDELLSALAAQNIRFITQMSIHAAHDEKTLTALSKAGCRGVLIGFETLNPDNLKAMGKGFNTMKGGYETALANLRAHRISVYGTFVFGYEHDTPASFDEALDFALSQKMYLAGFNHLTPFPGTPLYERLKNENRLRYESWWMDPHYTYNELPFFPKNMSPEEVRLLCVKTRKRFYSLANILKRSFGNAHDLFLWAQFFPINWMHHKEIGMRDGHPLGSAF